VVAGSGIDCESCLQQPPDPICGMDGLTYAHMCLAQCQDVEFDYYGPCNDIGASLIDTNATVTFPPGTDPDEVMNRFVDEGFRQVRGSAKV
jgi:hypothetical protein